MLLDNTLFFCDDQAFTASALCEYTFDLGAARKLFGGYGKQPRLVVNCSAHNGAITVAVKLIAADTSFTGQTAGDVLCSVPATEFVAGDKKEYSILPQTSARRFYGCYVTVSGTTSTTLDIYVSCGEAENLLS